MTFASQWELQTNYVEVSVTVDFDGDVKEYCKAYKADTDGNIAVSDITSSDLPTKVQEVGKLSAMGYVININTPASTKVYSDGKVTYGDNKTLPENKTIPSTSKLTVTYTFNSAQYAKLTVHSIAFKDGKDVTLYADKNQTYSYKQILDALITDVEAIKGATKVNDSVNYKTSDGKYLLTGWNEGAANLESTYSTTAVEFTLDAKLNGYNVVFMVKGQYETKFVEFGKLSQDLCTLDVSGLNHWVWIPFNDVAAGKLGTGSQNMTGLEQTTAGTTGSSFQTFSFASQSNIDLVEKVAATVTDADMPSVVFVACFESAPNTAYAIFDANKGAIKGHFGDNENIDRIVVSGKGAADSNDAAAISKPVSNPVYDGKKVFIGYTDYTDAKYKDAGSVSGFTSSVENYDHIISFYIDDNVGAKLYYSGIITSDGSVSGGKLVAFEYDGKIYDAANDKNFDKAVEAIQPEKDGYSFIQWNDKDGKKVFSVKSAADNKIIIESGDGFPKEGVKTDMNVYAQFDAKSYTIKYINSLGGEQTQKAYVGENVTLYGANTFINDNYTLIGWTTVPGESGTSYKLGGSYTLSGADYEKLAESAGTDDKVVVELYSEWQSNGSNVPGGNTGGDDSDNTALYLIAGMLAVIAILAIVGIVLMRRK